MRPTVYQDSPNLPPYRCAKCRAIDSSERDFWVDLGISYDWEGVVYLCSACITDVVKASDGRFFTAEQVKERTDALKSIVDDTAKKRAELERIKARLTYLGFDLNHLLEGEYGQPDSGSSVDTEHEVVRDSGDVDKTENPVVGFSLSL